MATSTRQGTERSGGRLQTRRSPSAVGGDAAWARWVPAATAAGLVGVALTHLLGLPEKLAETPWEGWVFITVSIAALTLAWLVFRAPDRSVYIAAAAVAGLPLLGYVLGRSIGLPGDTAEIGQWLAPLGVLSVLSGILVVAGAVYGARVRQ
jgi:hypothetical protein